MIKRLFRLFECTFRYRGLFAEPESKGCVRPVRRFKGNTVPESVKVGSEFFSSQWPKCQVIIWHQDEQSVYKAVACGFRYGNYLVTSSHCLPPGKYLALSTETSIVCELEYELVYDFDEVAIIKIHQQFYDEFSVKSARLSADVDTLVRITGCDVKMATSVGLLRPTDLFATYKYSGSTKPGFSGAPYMVGDTRVVAMHMCGGDAGNLCVSAVYIKSIIDKLEESNVVTPKQKRKNYVKLGKNQINIPEEALEKKKSKKSKHRNDWYTEEIEPSTKIRVRQSRRDPKEYDVELNGHYYTVDRNSLNDLQRAVKSKNGFITYDTGFDLGSDDGECDNVDSDESDFLDQQPRNSKPSVSSSSNAQLHSQEYQTLIVLMRQCLEDTLISFESKKLNNCTPPSVSGVQPVQTK